MKKLKKIARAVEEAQRIFNISTDLPIDIESFTDKLREAASVVAYFNLHEDFKKETCRNCGQIFAYAYYLTAIKCCSVSCMHSILQSIGLSWDPEAPLERRWGRYVPAIVPNVPMQIIDSLQPSTHLNNGSMAVDDIFDLIRSTGEWEVPPS